MARPRKIIPDTVGINMVELASKISRMSDAEAGAWLRKAIDDCRKGCQDPNCDPFIKVQYEITTKTMQKNQDHNSAMYQRRLKRQGKDLSQEKEIPAGERGKGSKVVSHPIDAPAGTLSTPEFSGQKKPYGTCGHVMLTDAEGHHLREVYGSDLKIAIDLLDAYAENNPKKFNKYKNHAAVLRKGNWVWNKVMEMKRQEKLLENANRRPTNWKAEERERTARVLRGESADGRNIVRDEDLTPEELEQKYA